MGLTDGISPHSWTAGINGQDADSLTQGIGEQRKTKKKK